MVRGLHKWTIAHDQVKPFPWKLQAPGGQDGERRVCVRSILELHCAAVNGANNHLNVAMERMLGGIAGMPPQSPGRPSAGSGNDLHLRRGGHRAVSGSRSTPFHGATPAFSGGSRTVNRSVAVERKLLRVAVSPAQSPWTAGMHQMPAQKNVIAPWGSIGLQPGPARPGAPCV